MNPLQEACLALSDFLRGTAPDPGEIAARDAERKRRQKAARAHIEAWRAQPVTGVTWVPQDAFAARMLELIDRPYLMQQAGFAACGPVALCAAVLHDYPDEVATLATALFVTGEGMLGKLLLSLTAAARACVESDIERDCRQVEHSAPPGADWLLFSSVQSAIAPSYAGLPAGTAARPHKLRPILAATELYGKIDIPRTGDTLDDTLASKRPNDSNLILLFLNSSLIDGKGDEDFILTPEHIVYLDRVEPAGKVHGEDSAVFSLYTWGKQLSDLFEIEHFMDGVNGYILGRRTY